MKKILKRIKNIKTCDNRGTIEGAMYCGILDAIIVSVIFGIALIVVIIFGLF